MTTSDATVEPNQPRGADRTARPGVLKFLSSQVRTLLWIVGGCVVIGLASVPWLLSDPARVARMLAGAMPGLQGDVLLDRVRIGWLGPIEFENLRVIPRQPAPATRPAVDGQATSPAANGEPIDRGPMQEPMQAPIRIRRIEVGNGLAGILLTLGDLGRVRVEGVEVDMVFDADRQSNLKSLFSGPAEQEAAGSTGGSRRAAVRTRLEVEDAVLRIAGPWAAETWVSDPIDVRASLAPAASGSHSVWSVEPVQLLKEARLEPSVAQGVLAYIAPILADAARTSGRFSLRIDGAELPVGEPAAGTLTGLLSMHEVNLGPGPLARNLIDALPGRLQPPDSIRIADDSNVEFRLAERRVWHKGLEFGLPLARAGQRLDVESSGSVGLDDRSLDVKLTLPIPADLPQDRPLVAALSGKTFSIGIGGVLGEPKVQFDGSIRASAGEVLVDLVDRLRAGRTNRPAPALVPPPADKKEAKKQGDGTAGETAGETKEGAASQIEKLKARLPPEIGGDSTAGAVIDLVGGVLDEVAKRRAERQAAEAANPQPPPPRRGRLLRRLAPPQQPLQQQPQQPPQPEP